MKQKMLYGAVGVLIIVAAFMVSGALINSKAAPKKDDKQHRAIYVKASKAVEKEISADMHYRGRVTAFDNVALASEVSGKILKGDVRFKEGERFKKGDVIVKIYSEDVKASLKSGKSNLLQTLSKILPDLKVDFPEEFNKWKTFFNAVDPENDLPLLPSIKTEKEKVFLASNNVLSTYYSLQQQEINLKRYTIRAPFNGSFMSVNKEIGAVASPGGELAKIARSDKLEVVVPVFPSDLKWIKTRDKVEFNGDNQAVISRIAGFVDENTQSVNVYLTYNANNTSTILQGQYVDVAFKGGEIKGLEIPREALIDNNAVYALDNGKLQKQKVEIIRQLNDSYIVSGVDEGKMIVMESMATIDSSVEYLAR
ncbi:HlyD family efflux transporter periplasmic adaptor subunit [Prolixibacteraceae bacterium JC049]|nr:HlyD family efflux transporter periplasmic adaptor subunit [Prolixibacteraceae bacterium JC049]